jgi:hypothetical protein
MDDSDVSGVAGPLVLKRVGSSVTWPRTWNLRVGGRDYINCAYVN